MRLLPLCSLILATALLAGCQQPSPPPASVPSADAAHPAAAPAADPASAVLEASRRFASLRSFHAEMTLHGAQAGQVVRSGMDFVAPDRYRLETPAGVQTIIGDTFFLQAEGRMQQVPLPAGTLEQWRSPLPSEARLQDLRVEDRGPADIDGTATRVYRIDGPAGSGETLQYWIGGDGLPRQIQRDGFNKQQPYRITLRYSRLNDPSLQVPPPGDAASPVLNGDL
ncbi:hypothetical protein CXF96_05585 [Stenotrophomonas sp. Betaine-02u-21]|uniref:hypothetical protein n=1 Tax=unclassified Stenotrophomonas TaxID=196198 RepID=UPI000C3463A2|nr:MULTISPECIES: hypothetical protein [unclassified Stenotrophomonas]PKH69812.1 hypothetical protein CXF90_17295 [Stenotrophomonas sp. Betaine-02u-23]PKH75094.1 hypothetical protein CXF96_05585 [Stenotrophomonas sp. Betaine-02u-21]PKH94418.1 hypothetical protein CXG43_17310 [Stenotrophomonas sp. Bg11-02]